MSRRRLVWKRISDAAFRSDTGDAAERSSDDLLAQAGVEAIDCAGCR